MLVAVNLRKLAFVHKIGLPVLREQGHGLLPLFKWHLVAGDENVSVDLRDHVATNIGEHTQQLPVVLTMLLIEIADHRVERVPKQRIQ